LFDLAQQIRAASRVHLQHPARYASQSSVSGSGDGSKKSRIRVPEASDLYTSRSVGTVMGMGGTASGIGTAITTYLIGFVSDHYSFTPVLIGAGIVPLVATGITLLLVPNGNVNQNAN